MVVMSACDVRRFSRRGLIEPGDEAGRIGVVAVTHPLPTLRTVDPLWVVGQRALRAYWSDIVSRYSRRPATAAEVDAVVREFPSDDLVLPRGLMVVAVAEREPVGCGEHWFEKRL